MFVDIMKLVCSSVELVRKTLSSFCLFLQWFKSRRYQIYVLDILLI